MPSARTQAAILLRDALPLALTFGLFKLLLQFALTLWSLHQGYGYFRDEFYYVLCGRHLAWGYVDHAPLVALQARLGELLFGDSVFALRILSTLAGALAVTLTGLLTASFGGKRPAQALAMLCTLVAGVFLATGSFLNMNSWEPVFWTAIVLGLRLLVLDPDSANAPTWLAIGLTAGLGLLNKPSLAVFLLCLLAGLLLTPERRLLRNRWALAATLLAAALVSPFLAWEIRHSFPLLEFLHNGVARGKNIVLGPWDFLLAQLLQLNPVTAPVWIIGLLTLLRARTIPHARSLGLAALFFFPLMYALHAKDYYLAPIYPLLFAAGAIACAAIARADTRPGLAGLLCFEAVIAAAGVLFLPMALPVLRPPTFLRYTAALGIPSSNSETSPSGPLPQFFADRFGWQQELSLVDAALTRLSPDERTNTAILVSNYGEAASLEVLGHNLPPVLSGHNNYFLWGSHGFHGGNLLVLAPDTPRQLTNACQSAEVIGRMNDPYAMPFEHRTLYLLRDCHIDLTRTWPHFKNYI